MRYLERTMSTPAENLALDEVLLEQAERHQGAVETQCLRVWESLQSFVVLGRSSPYRDEVDRAYCEEHDIPVLRRVSGGATVVAGPGCLMYAVVLSYAAHPELRMLDAAHRFVMQRQKAAIQRIGLESEMAGTCDLVWQGKKFSGNSLRCLRHCFLYHGTFLYRSDLEQLARCLRTPTRQPEYRQGRSHLDFVTNLPVEVKSLVESLKIVWQVDSEYDDFPAAASRQLARDKYERLEWTQSR